MGYLIDILIDAVRRIVTAELSAHVGPTARWIIGNAVKRLPVADRDRFCEEWLAHLDETPGALRKLWHAFGCHIAVNAMAGVLTQQEHKTVMGKQEPLTATENFDRWLTNAQKRFRNGDQWMVGQVLDRGIALWSEIAPTLSAVEQQAVMAVLIKKMNEQLELL